MKNNFLWSLLVIVLVTGFGISVASCGDDNDEEWSGGGSESSSLSGWWMDEEYVGWENVPFCTALHFTGRNTVDYYPLLAADKQYWGSNTVAFPGKSGWYCQRGGESHCTYTLQGNTLYITDGGSVRTISCYNGTPSGFHKVKN